MTVKDCAKYLNMNSSSVARLCRTGRIPAIKISYIWVINKSKLDDMLNKALFRMIK